LNPHVAAVDPTQLMQGFLEHRETGLLVGLDCCAHERADAPHPVRLLRTRREGPSSRRATDKCDEFASPHRLAPLAEGLTLPCCGLHCASRQILAAHVRFGSKADIAVECAPDGGQVQAAVLTDCWAWWSSYCTGLM